MEIKVYRGIFIFVTLTAVFHLAAADMAIYKAGDGIVIEQVGLSEHTDDYIKNRCAKFKLSEAQVKTYFLQATNIESRVYTHDRYSPCYVKGVIVSEGSRKATWKIHSGRTSIVNFEDGAAQILFCAKCRWDDPFAGGYSVE